MTQQTIQRLLFFLTGTVLILVIVFFTLQPKQPITRYEMKISNKVTPEEARDSVFVTLKDFGLDDSLCREIKKKDLQKQNADLGYTVSVPSDLPIPFLIQEIETKFSTKGAFVSSVEKKNGLEFESVISDSSSWKIVFRFYSNDKLHRPVYEIARLLRVAKDAGDDDFTSILSGLDEATLLLPLTKPAAKATSRITGSRCFYLVDLSDMSDEQAFKLDVSFTKKRLDQSLDEIMKNFPALRYVYIRTNSPVHNSTVWPYVRNYLQKKNIIIFTELDVIPFVPVSSAPGAALTSVLEQTRQAGKSIVLSASADKKALQDLTMRAGKFGVALVSLDSIKTNRPKIK